MSGSDSICKQCSERNIKCEWKNATTSKNTVDYFSENSEEHVFAKMFRDNDQTRPQFVCSTQPLALLLSRDSILCFDGDAYGLYFPWRGSDQALVERESELTNFLEKKGVFQLPPVAEQRYLVGLFLDNLYPFYPVVNRNILEDIHNVPLILLNAIFLAAVRFDKRMPKSEIRPRLSEFFHRCKWLEMTESNKVVLIQSFLLLSIHEEGMEGPTSSKQYISKASNLCGELAITNLGGIMGNYMFGAPLGKSRGYNYSKQLLSRIFWCTFCLDRMVSATSGREMIFNRKDMLVDPIRESDFDCSRSQKADHAIFSSWLGICELIERIQCALYRPPQNRSIDSTLSSDLIRWSPPHVELESYDKCITFLRISHCYAQLLHLRSAIDSITLMLGEAGEPQHSAQSILGQIHSCSRETLGLVNPPYLIHNVLVVHVILHVVALLQLECKINSDTAPGSEFASYYHDMSTDSLLKLTGLKDYWWYAGTALLLCQEVFELS